MTSEQHRMNVEKSLALASILFPHEEWIPKEANIWVAKSRLAVEYREPEKQEHSVFIHLVSDLKIEAVKAKIAGELKDRMDKGSFICLFKQSGELYFWTYSELRAIIRKKNTPPSDARQSRVDE
jgi:hypothetical protein